MQFLWKYIDDLVGKGLEWKIIAELMLYASVSLVPMSLPLAILMAALMTFGNLGEFNELSALKSSGISLGRILMPLIVLIILLCYLAFLFSNNVLPYSNLKMRALLYDVRQQRPEFQIKEGVFYNGIDNYSIKISQKDTKSSLLKGIMIYDHSARNGNTKVMVADSGYMKMTANKDYLMVTLYDGYSYSEEDANWRKTHKSNTYPARRDRFDKQVFFISMDGFDFERTNESLFKNHYQMLNLKQLEKAKDSLSNQYDKRVESFQRSLIKLNLFRKEGYSDNEIHLSDSLKQKISNFNLDSLYNSLSLNDKKVATNQALVYARSTKSYLSSTQTELDSRKKMIIKHEIEWYRKFSLSFACFIFFFIGAPLGAIIRKGGLGLPAVISVVFFLLYYAISITGEKFANKGVWSSFNGMWISTFILFPVGIFLTYKASTDSLIFNVDIYLEFLKRINIFKKLIKKVEEFE